MKSENQEQIEVIQWCKRNAHLYPELDMIFWIRNESRSKRVRMSGKLKGIKPGVSDLFLSVANRGFHGLYIEMKSKKGKLSNHQKEWFKKVKSQGYAAVVANGSEAAIVFIKSYLEIS